VGIPDEPHNGYRMTASCIPAALGLFRKLRETEPIIQGLSENESDSLEAEDLTAWTGPAREALAEIVEAGYRVPDHDSKLEELIAAFEAIWEDDDRHKTLHRKIVVFSFFVRRWNIWRERLMRDEFRIG